MSDLLLSARFPRASTYHPDWLRAGCSGAANPLWLTEWLGEALVLRPGLRVLDLGCGRALSSIFLRRTFGVEVWAADLWFDPSENLRRIRDAGVADGVFPLRVDARVLPFAAEFFDAIVSIDSYFYYGTCDLYLNTLARHLKPGGTIGIAGVGLAHEIDGAVPDHLRAWWDQDRPWCLHSAAWWQRHWEKTGLLDVTTADDLPDGWRCWLDWLRVVAPGNAVEIAALEEDRGRTLGYVRAVGRLRADAPLSESIVSIPAQYEPRPLLRDPS